MQGVIELQQVALVVTVALTFSLLFERFKQPTILGHIIVGVILGPFGLGYIESVETVDFLAELGVLMVLFVVGMSLDLNSFKRTMNVSLAVMCGQLMCSLLLAFGLTALLGWPMELCLLLAFILALSSTAVAVKMLEVGHEVNTDAGRVALGVLIAQDLAIVPMILVLRDVGHGIQWGALFVKIAFALGILTVFVWALGQQRRMPRFFHFSAESTELPALMGLSFCFGFATLSGFLGLSVAYGAFLAGLVLGNLRERLLIKQMVMPIYSVLVMTFFLSVGFFIDLGFIGKNLGLIVLLSLLIFVFKTLMNMGLLRLLKQPWPTTFLAGVALSQLGEFSFLLLSVCRGSAWLSSAADKMMITLTAISLGISPLWLSLARRLRAYHIGEGASLDQTLHVYLGRNLTSAVKRVLKKKNAD